MSKPIRLFVVLISLASSQVAGCTVAPQPLTQPVTTWPDCDQAPFLLTNLTAPLTSQYYLLPNGQPCQRTLSSIQPEQGK